MMDMEDKGTMLFYNEHADEYFANTVHADMSVAYEKFISYLRSGGRIVDLGAGSGRDIAYFLKKGYMVDGIDASSELCLLASKYFGVVVRCQTIQDWEAEKIYDGIWANASLLHLKQKEMIQFLQRAVRYLSDTGVMYISLKSGIRTGTDHEGRYFVNYSMEEVQQIVEKSTTFNIVEQWTSGDSLARDGFLWINLILKKAVFQEGTCN